MLRAVIKLFDRLRMRNFFRADRFSIFRIRLSFRSSTSRFGSESIFSMVSMKFLLRISTLRLWSVGSLLISDKRFYDRSRNCRFGRLTKFSILVTSF